MGPETTQSSLQSAKVRSIVYNPSHVWITSSIERDSATNVFTVDKLDAKTKKLKGWERHFRGEISLSTMISYYMFFILECLAIYVLCKSSAVNDCTSVWFDPCS